MRFGTRQTAREKFEQGRTEMNQISNVKFTLRILTIVYSRRQKS